MRDKEGGTKYLRTSANDELHIKVSPLVDTALTDVGVYEQFDGLAEEHSFIRDAGLNRESINGSVTDQALDGIFAYMGREERKFRDNPVGNVGGAWRPLLIDQSSDRLAGPNARGSSSDSRVSTTSSEPAQ